MSEKHVAKHRSAPERPSRSRLRHRIRNAAVLSGIAVAATGLVVSTGVLAQPLPLDGAAAAVSTASPAKSMSQDELAEREGRASRSTDDRRPEADRGKARTLSNASGVAVTNTEDLSNADPRDLAKALMPQFGMSSSAYGIPQALPGSKMSSAGPDWANNPETQIRWGLGYIKGRYGSACAAWSYKQGAGWY